MKKKILASVLLLAALILWKIDLKNLFVKSEGCPFCLPENLANSTFYEDANCLGLITYKPIVPGHILLVPKRHIARFEELTGEEISSLGEAIKKIDLQVKKVFGNTDYLLLQKNGRTAGQTVPHVHFHYIPGKNGLMWHFLVRPYLKPISTKQICDLKDDLSNNSH